MSLTNISIPPISYWQKSKDAMIPQISHNYLHSLLKCGNTILMLKS